MAHKTFFKKIIFITLAVLISLFALSAVQAAGDPPTSSVGSLLKEAAESAKYETAKVESGDINTSTVAGGVVRIFLSILGIIFIVLMIYAGYLWMMARGNEEQVNKAKDLIRDAVIGLIIVVAAYAVTYFILYMLARGYIQSEVTGL
ncbi:MAG: hypothetical protein PHZ04_04100 [Patescibacteria group bacterium]|nr:hypothetical protein [Patescibacteria group bacterium]MDD5554022.1 hypothetical protein [Patescibacteria group bacterium]